MPDRAAEAFSYAVLRVVPDLARGERFNAGVVLFCRRLAFLGVRWELDPARLASLAPAADPGLAAALAEELELRARVAAGEPGAGPLSQLPPSDRFGWLVAPTSTMIQPSQVHTGLCGDPAEQLATLFAQLVAAR